MAVRWWFMFGELCSAARSHRQTDNGNPPVQQQCLCARRRCHRAPVHPAATYPSFVLSARRGARLGTACAEQEVRTSARATLWSRWCHWLYIYTHSRWMHCGSRQHVGVFCTTQCGPHTRSAGRGDHHKWSYRVTAPPFRNSSVGPFRRAKRHTKPTATVQLSVLAHR